MLLIYMDEPSPRAKYVIEHVLHQVLGWDLMMVDDAETFRSSVGPKLFYGRSDPGAGVFHIPSSGWLNNTGIEPFEPELVMDGELPVIFRDQNGFDLFAAVFHLISRYEEYLDHEKDQHARMRSRDHFMVKHELAGRPIVDHWIMRTAHAIRSQFPELPAPDRRYQHVVTADIDNGLKYLGRPFWKQGGAALRDLVKGSPSLAQERIAVLLGARPDPFADQSVLIEAARSKAVARTIAFVLVEDRGAFDHAANIDHEQMRRAIGELAGEIEIGIHPSYESSSRPGTIAREKQRLHASAGVPIRTSRQHFLRWRMPDTLRELEAEGILEDHSLGFSDRIGFRAGTCTPFRWYDLQQERVSDLVLHPFAAMDSALHDHMGMRPKEAAAAMLDMSRAVRAVNGTFVSVWHDRFLSGHGERKGWPEAFKQVCEAAAP